MGNVEGHDITPLTQDVKKKELNLSRNLTHKQFCKHVSGDPSEVCLEEIPWGIRDAISLFERMDVSFNSLIEIPVELPLRLPHLNYINLSHNKLNELPESISLFFHLKTLLLANNLLKSLPTSFASLKKLEKLDLSGNLLRELPVELAEMPSLARLNVSKNKLRRIPRSYGSSQSLAVLLATNNRLVEPPQSVCNEGSRATIDWLKKNASTATIIPDVEGGNLFPRVRGSQLSSSVPNTHSAEAAYMQAQTNMTNTSSRLKTPLLPPAGATNLDPYDLRDKIIGMLYGAAIGDAIAIATEGMTPDECQFHYDAQSLSYEDIMRDELRVRWKQGDWTNSFDQVVLVLDSLTSWGGVVDELDFAQRLMAWSESGFKELGDQNCYINSNTLAKVLEDPMFVKDPHHVAWQVSESSIKGNILKRTDQGAICRSVMLGVPQFHDLNEVVLNSVRICRATHADPCCIAASTMISVLIAMILQGRCGKGAIALEEIIEDAGAIAVQHLTEDAYLEQFITAKSCSDVNNPGIEEGHPFEPIARAVAMLRKKNSYRQSITELAMLGGNSCVSGCLTGALLGCLYGYNKLPAYWLAKLRKKQTDWLNIKINILLDMMAIP